MVFTRGEKMMVLSFFLGGKANGIHYPGDLVAVHHPSFACTKRWVQTTPTPKKQQDATRSNVKKRVLRKKTSYFPLYWLVYRDRYIGLSKSPYNWVV